MRLSCFGSEKKMVDNTLLDLHNSSDDNQPQSIIVKYYIILLLLLLSQWIVYALSVEWCNQSITQTN